MNLKTYLKRKRLTQAAFAKEVGVTQGAVWQWITDKQQISAEKAILVERATGGMVPRHEMRPDLWPTRESA